MANMYGKWARHLESPGLDNHTQSMACHNPWDTMIVPVSDERGAKDPYYYWTSTSENHPQLEVV